MGFVFKAKAVSSRRTPKTLNPLPEQESSMFQPLWQSSKRHPPRAAELRRRAFRPRVEALEDRTLLSIGLVSGNAAGTDGGNAFSLKPSVSADGRFVAFASLATDLVPGQVDTPGTADVFVRDLVTGVTTLVSHSTAGPATAGNKSSDFPALSADGRFVAFLSAATDLIPGFVDGNGSISGDVFLYDRATGSTSLVSRSTASPSQGGAGDSSSPVLSGDGRFVAFPSAATDLVAAFSDNNAGASDLYLRDMTAGVTTLVSRSTTSATSGGHGETLEYQISSDGRFVAFRSTATDLVDGFIDGNAALSDIFLRDTQSNTTALVSHASGSATSGGNGVSLNAVLSANGQFVAFVSQATDLIAGVVDGNGTNDVFRYDVSTGANELISHSTTSATTSGNKFSNDPQLSADGTVVAFASGATDLVSGLDDTNAAGDVFVRSGGTTRLVSVARSGTAAANGESSSPCVSGDGRFVAFTSLATDLASGVADANGTSDVFLRDLAGERTTALSTVPAGNQTGNKESSDCVLNGDGSRPVFLSDSGNLVAHDSNGKKDLFAPLPPGPLQFSVLNQVVAENAGGVTLTVLRQGGSDGTVGVSFVSVAGTATAGLDFFPVAGTLTFGTGEVIKSFTIPLPDDNLAEGPEFFFVSLTAPSGGAVLGPGSVAAVTLLDNDPPPQGNPPPLPPGNPLRVPLFVVGSGLGQKPLVRVFNADGTLRFQFFALSTRFRSGVRVASGDVNGDAFDDIVVAAGRGGRSLVRVFSGLDLAPLATFSGFTPAVNGDVFVLAQDVNGDGLADIVLLTRVRRRTLVNVFRGPDLALLRSLVI
jgi:Tol biopolymer transport system component